MKILPESSSIVTFSGLTNLGGVLIIVVDTTDRENCVSCDKYSGIDVDLFLRLIVEFSSLDFHVLQTYKDNSFQDEKQ